MRALHGLLSQIAQGWLDDPTALVHEEEDGAWTLERDGEPTLLQPSRRRQDMTARGDFRPGPRLDIRRGPQSFGKPCAEQGVKQGKCAIRLHIYSL